MAILLRAIFSGDIDCAFFYSKGEKCLVLAFTHNDPVLHKFRKSGTSYVYKAKKIVD